MKACDVDEENSLLSMALSQDGIPPPDPVRVDWPKVNGSLCQEKEFLFDFLRMVHV